MAGSCSLRRITAYFGGQAHTNMGACLHDSAEGL
jgi:hypothetical protein